MLCWGFCHGHAWQELQRMHRWRSVDLSEYSWTFISALLERDISKGLIWVKSDFVLLLSNVDGCLLGLRLDDPC